MKIFRKDSSNFIDFKPENNLDQKVDTVKFMLLNVECSVFFLAETPRYTIFTPPGTGGPGYLLAC